eukprot:2419361-Rhodomonas_salina.1
MLWVWLLTERRRRGGGEQRVLARLHTHILPSLSQPLLLADVLTDCFSYHPPPFSLALSGLCEGEGEGVEGRQEGR